MIQIHLGDAEPAEKSRPPETKTHCFHCPFSALFPRP